jgi:hypothetical protein
MSLDQAISGAGVPTRAEAIAHQRARYGDMSLDQVISGASVATRSEVLARRRARYADMSLDSLLGEYNDLMTRQAARAKANAPYPSPATSTTPEYGVVILDDKDGFQIVQRRAHGGGM